MRYRLSSDHNRLTIHFIDASTERMFHFDLLIAIKFSNISNIPAPKKSLVSMRRLAVGPQLTKPICVKVGYLKSIAMYFVVGSGVGLDSMD